MKTNPLQLMVADGASEHVLRFIQMTGRLCDNHDTRDREIADYWVNALAREPAPVETPISGTDAQKIARVLMTWSPRNSGHFLVELGKKIDSLVIPRETAHIVAGIFDGLGDVSGSSSFVKKVAMDAARPTLAKMFSVSGRELDGKEKSALSGSVAACLKAWEEKEGNAVFPGTSPEMLGLFYSLVQKAQKMSDLPPESQAKRLGNFGAALADEICWKLFAKIAPRARLEVLSRLLDEPKKPESSPAS